MRAARRDEAAALAALINSAYRGESSRIGWTTEADLLGGQRIDAESLLQKIEASDSVLLVHEDGGAPAACVHLERAGPVCCVGLLTIRPAAQGQGTGRRLLAAAERWAAAQWSTTRMRMHVIAQRRELIEWYERRGYHRTGEQHPFPYGDPRFGLPRRDDLIFDVLEKAIS